MTDSKIIAVANSKGGSGKTTTTHNVGTMLAHAGYRTGIIDFDLIEEKSLQKGSQTSLVKTFYDRMDYGYLLDPFYEDRLSVTEEVPSSWAEVIDELKDDNADFILCDFAGTITPALLSVMARADYILCPLKPEPNDVRELDSLMSVIQSLKDSRQPKNKITILPIGLHATSKSRAKSQLEWINDEIDERSELFHILDNFKMSMTTMIPDAMQKGLGFSELYNHPSTKNRVSNQQNYYSYNALFNFLTGKEFQWCKENKLWA